LFDRVENAAQKKQRRKRNPSMLTSESEFTALSSRNILNTTNLTESYPGETSTHRRHKIATQQLSASHTMVEPITALASNSNRLLPSTDELEMEKRCPIEKLTYYFEQHDIEDEEDFHHVQSKNEFATTPNSFHGTLNVNMKQEATNTAVR